MKNETITVFLPTRKGSQRVKNKNIRQFSIYKNGLLDLKLKQLVELSGVNEIILSTNDDACIRIAKEYQLKYGNVKIISRPDELALSSTDLTDLIEYVPSICSSTHILWTHVTSPFINANDYERAISDYFKCLNNGYDSLMSGRLYNDYLWDNEINDIINRNSTKKWPRTQDLKPLYQIDNGIFLASKNIYSSNHDRIGANPFIFQQNEIKAFDIDWEDDFAMAELMYDRFLKI
jgi:CMP-N-acetylneuraminic acid synthetase